MSGYLYFFRMEIQRILAYRLSFWINLVLSTLIKVLVSWYLWDAIFNYSQKTTIGGFTQSQMQFYFLLAPLISEIIMPRSNDFAAEIYDGSLTKYLLYPISYFWVCFSRQSAHFVAGLFKTAIGISIYAIFYTIPIEFSASPMTLIVFLVISYLAFTLHFIMTLCLDFFAFWLDIIWNLKVMLRFMIQLLGGVMIPISAFPEQLQSVLQILPFQYLCWIPIRILTQTYSLIEIIQFCCIFVIWIAVTAFICRQIFAKGQYQYSGVGI